MNRVSKRRTKAGNVDAMRQEEAEEVEEKRDEDLACQREDSLLINREDKAANPNVDRAEEIIKPKWAPHDVIKSDIRKDEGILYHPLRNSTGVIVSMHPDKLRIGKLSEQKLLKSPRFNGKVLRCPGRYYVLDSETKHEISVYPHIKLIAYYFRFKLTKFLNSANVKLNVNSFDFPNYLLDWITFYLLFFRT